MRIEPEQELAFVGTKGDTTGQLKSYLTITNVFNSGSLAFKVKTTAPRQYIVKPNQGILDRGQKITIDITLIQSAVSSSNNSLFHSWSDGSIGQRKQ